MRRFLIAIILCVLIYGCDTLNTKTYYAVISNESPDILTGSINTHESRDTIQAVDSLDALKQAISYYVASVQVYNQMRKDVKGSYYIRPIGYKITDKYGNDLTFEFPKKYKDSLLLATLKSYNVKDFQIDSANNTVKTIKPLNPYLDTSGDGESPVKILSAKFIAHDEYSNYKDVHLVYKNLTSKKINAIRFSWYGINAFNDPAECGNYSILGLGGGFDDSGLGANDTDDGTWSILSKDGKKILRAWVTEIAFSDGTKWEHQ